MKFPVKGKSGTEYTADTYKELSVDAKRAEGFFTDPDVVYERVEDKVEGFTGVKQYTLDAIADVDGDGKNDKLPVGTIIHGMEEAHFNYDGVEPEV